MGCWLITAESGCSDDLRIENLAVTRSERVAGREAQRFAEVGRALTLSRRGLKQRRGYYWSFAGEDELPRLSRLWAAWGERYAPDSVVVAYVPSVGEDGGYEGARIDLMNVQPDPALVERLVSWWGELRCSDGGISAQAISELVGRFSNNLIRTQTAMAPDSLRNRRGDS